MGLMVIVEVRAESRGPGSNRRSAARCGHKYSLIERGLDQASSLHVRPGAVRSSPAVLESKGFLHGLEFPGMIGVAVVGEQLLDLHTLPLELQKPPPWRKADVVASCSSGSTSM